MSAFLRLWIWFSFRELRGHAWRTVAVLLGISLGAGVFTSVRLAANASVQSFANGMDAISGRADRTVTRPGGRPSRRTRNRPARFARCRCRFSSHVHLCPGGRGR